MERCFSLLLPSRFWIFQKLIKKMMKSWKQTPLKFWTGHIQFPSQFLKRLDRHIRPPTRTWPGFWHPNGGYKRLPHLSSTVGHSFHIANTLRHSLELLTSLLQASFKSKLPRWDLRLTLEWPTRSSSQALHRWSSCVCYSWWFVSLDGLSCLGVTKIVVDPRKFVLPSPLWGFDSGNWTRSWWSFGVD
jgi:hypothetical protein